MLSEYWFFLAPFVAGIGLLIYFTHHVFKARMFSHYIFNIILLKVFQLEQTGIIINKQIEILVENLKQQLQNNKKIHLLEMERLLGISLHVLEKKLDKELRKGQKTMDVKTLKKELYKNLATSLFGNLVGKSNTDRLITKRMYFSNNDRGDFYLLALKNDELSQLNLSEEILFSVFKEQETALDIVELKLEGKAELLTSESDEWQTGLRLLEEKSPVAANLPWLESPHKCVMLLLKAENISYQTVKDEQAEKKPYLFSRKGD